MPLCVTLSAITSVVTVFTIPFLIDLALRVFFDEGQELALSALPMLSGLILLTVLPLAIGMLVRQFFRCISRKGCRADSPDSALFHVGVLILGAVASYQHLIDIGATAGTIVVALNVLTMALGYGAARAFRLPLAQVVTITFEVGVQNLSLAFAITFNMLRRPDLAVAGLLYAVVMPATALAFVSIARRLAAPNATIGSRA